MKPTFALLAAFLWAAPALAAPVSVSGRVVDAQGKPAAKAWVAVIEARDREPIQTDGNGVFAFPDLSLTQFTLLAAKDRDWAKQSGENNNAQAILKLQTSATVVDRARAIERLVAIEGGVSPDRLFAAWDALGIEGVERFLWRKGEPADEITERFGAELARRDPAQLLRRAPELLASVSGEARENLDAQIQRVRAGADDADERASAGVWLDEQTQFKREISARGVTQLLQMAAVAQRLKRPDAAQWLDYAAAVAAQLKGNAEPNARAWSSALADLGADAIARFSEERSADENFYLWVYAAPIMARAGDAVGAQQMLARLKNEVSATEMTQLVEGARQQSRVSPLYFLQEAKITVASVLSETDPVAAFAVAQETGGDYRARAMMRVADGARRAGNAELAVQSLSELRKTRTGVVEYYAQAAAIGARLNPQLGAELFARARGKAFPPNYPANVPPPSIGGWAFYHAPHDAAQSRVLVEREWNWRLPAARVNESEFFALDYFALYKLVGAMTVIDAERAAEMRTQMETIDSRNYITSMAQLDLVVAALATPRQREQLSAVGVD